MTSTSASNDDQLIAVHVCKSCGVATVDCCWEDSEPCLPEDDLWGKQQLSDYRHRFKWVGRQQLCDATVDMDCADTLAAARLARRAVWRTRIGLYPDAH
jgi:hypothetical protein